MVQHLTPFKALQRAVEIAGSQSALARICGVSQTAVWKWLQSSKRLPAEHVLKVEAATGVSRHLSRPDIYPLDQAPTPTFGDPGVSQFLEMLALAHDRVTNRHWNDRRARRRRSPRQRARFIAILAKIELLHRQKRGCRIWWPKGVDVEPSRHPFSREPVALAEGGFTPKRPPRAPVVPFGRHRRDDIPF